MSVRFVLGRAGTGKTAHCIRAVREKLAESPADGSRLILLVPEQASFQMERALLTGEISAYHRCEVLSFKRLAFKVLAQHAPDHPVISAFARAMIVRHLLGRHAKDLKLFRRAAESGTAFERLSETLVELFEQAVTPEQLDAGRVAGPSDPLLTVKLHDLGLLYRAYLDFLGNDRLDAAQHLDQARRYLPQCDWLRGAWLWVDGFAGFTGQEMELLVDLLGLAERADISLLLDPAARIVDYPSGDLDPYSLFAPTERTYARLHGRCVKASISVEPPVRLSSDDPPRFRRSPELARIEKRLFRWPISEEAPGRSKKVQLITAADRRTEVAAAIGQIHHWVSLPEDPLRYRQIALIVRDLDVYHDFIVAELTGKSIPFFIDRRRSTAHHVLVELVRSLTAVPAAGFSLASIRLLLKTGLLGCTDEQADGLENYLLAHGIEGLSPWQGPRWMYHRDLTIGGADDEETAQEDASLQQIHESRRAFWEPLADWFELAAGGEQAVETWVRALIAALDHLGVGGKVDSMIRSALDDGRYEEAEEHRQVFADVQAVLADLVDALGAERMDVVELGTLLETGLACLSVALAPPTVDQILVGSIERSRHPEIRAACILGFNESIFPLVGSQDPVLGDDDRETLARAGLDLRPTRRQRLLDERLLAYIAASRPSEFLWISFPLVAEDGKALEPSPFVEELKAALPGLEAVAIGDPAAGRALWQVHTSQDLAAALAFELRTRPQLERDDRREQRRRFNALYSFALNDVPARERLVPALAGLAFENRATLSEKAIADLYFLPFRTSVSQLEQYAACPFKHFAGYGLRLEPRRTADLQAIDLGSLLHKVLEVVVKDLIREKLRFADLTDEQISERVDRAFAAYGPSVSEELAFRLPRNRFLIEQGRQQVIDALHAQRELSKASNLRPIGTEICFGLEGPWGLPALEIPTVKGRSVLLRGKIDRVDVGEGPSGMIAVVHDYKRSLSRKLGLAEVYHGLSLQLPAYLLALRDVGKGLTGKPVRAVAAFFINLLRGIETQTERPAEPVDDAALAARFKPRGLIEQDVLLSLDRNLSSGRSQLLAAYVNKDGGIGHLNQGDAAPSPAFAALLDHVADRIAGLADEILDGHIEVRPYRLNERSPCSMCEFGDVCRFEYHPAAVRSLEPLSRTEVFDRLVSEEGD